MNVLCVCLCVCVCALVLFVFITNQASSCVHVCVYSSQRANSILQCIARVTMCACECVSRACERKTTKVGGGARAHVRGNVYGRVDWAAAESRRVCVCARSQMISAAGGNWRLARWLAAALLRGRFAARFNVSLPSSSSSSSCAVRYEYN